MLCRNYTNVCSYKCQFCAFSKGKTAEDLRGPAYLLSMHEISRRTAEAWERGATEVCMQVSKCMCLQSACGHVCGHKAHTKMLVRHFTIKIEEPGHTPTSSRSCVLHLLRLGMKGHCTGLEMGPHRGMCAGECSPWMWAAAQ